MIKLRRIPMIKKYDTDPESEYFGMRLTNCCAAHSTYSMDTSELFCKACFGTVAFGEGDGTEQIQENTDG